jgi:transposase-like protein
LKGQLEMASRRKFTKDFKIAAVARLNSGQTLAEVARALEVHPTMVMRWREQLEDRGEEAAFPGRGNGKPQEQSRIAELERKVGQQQMEIDFLERALRRIDEQRRLQGANRPARSINKSRKK